MPVVWDEAYFYEGIRRVDSFCFLYVQDFGGMQRDS